MTRLFLKLVFIYVTKGPACLSLFLCVSLWGPGAQGPRGPKGPICLKAILLSQQLRLKCPVHSCRVNTFDHKVVLAGTYFDISDKVGKNRNFGGWRKSEAEARKVKNIQIYWNYDKITRSHLPAEK